MVVYLLVLLFLPPTTTRPQPRRAAAHGPGPQQKSPHGQAETPLRLPSPGEPRGNPRRSSRLSAGVGGRPAGGTGSTAPWLPRTPTPGRPSTALPPCAVCKGTGISSPGFPSRRKGQGQDSAAGAPRPGGAAASRPAEPSPPAAPRQPGEGVRRGDTRTHTPPAAPPRRGPGALPQPPAACPVPPRQRRAFVRRDTKPTSPGRLSRPAARRDPGAPGGRRGRRSASRAAPAHRLPD